MLIIQRRSGYISRPSFITNSFKHKISNYNAYVIDYGLDYTRAFLLRARHIRTSLNWLTFGFQNTRQRTTGSHVTLKAGDNNRGRWSRSRRASRTAPVAINQDSTLLSQACCESRSATDLWISNRPRIFMPAVNIDQQEVTRDAIGT